MTSMCYLIVCVNLLYSFDEAVYVSRTKAKKLLRQELNVMAHTLTPANQYQLLTKKLTPYWNLPYDEQLKKKQKRCCDLVNTIENRSQRLKNLITYKILEIVPSPVTKAYRNIDEFYIGHGVDGKPNTVGCTLGALALGKVFSVHPTKIVSIKESHKRVAQVYEDFIRFSSERSSLIPYDGGHWFTLIVRSNEAGDIMATITVKGRRYKQIWIQRHQRILKQYFLTHLPNISLCHQVCYKEPCAHLVAPITVLYGKPFLSETLNGYFFTIAPHSIFPKNKFGAEVLYDTLIRIAKLKSNTLVLDIHARTGISSIMVSRFVREAVVLDPSKEEAKQGESTALLNNAYNVKFLVGRVKHNLNSIVDSLSASSDVVVLLNHRLTLLELDDIKTIRETVQISRIVCINYKADSEKTIKYFVHLCSDSNSTVPPFRLTKVVPVDLLPQTLYVELILMFQREPVANI